MNTDELVIASTIVGAVLVIFTMVAALVEADVRRSVRKLQTRKPRRFSPPGQGYQPLECGPQGAPPRGGRINFVPTLAHMGRLTPDAPKPRGAFKCSYCGRFGAPGSCEGCGAPNEPSGAEELLDVSTFSERKYIRPIFQPNRIVREGTIVPAFDMVKR